jgi:diguanylate cyclase
VEMKRESSLEAELVAAQDKLAAVESQSHDIRKMLEEERARATTDLLTQLPNRVVWEERLAFEEARFQRYGHPIVIGVIDIDEFKLINDKHGHKIGDRVLQLVARTMRANLRKTDFIARYGGEEFVLLLTDTSLEVARQVVEGLRERVASLPLYFQGEPVHITVSIGLAAMGSAPTAMEVFDRADRALYQAKAEGRNRVVADG